MAHRLVSSNKTHQVRFTSLLKRTNGGTLKPQVGFEILGDLPHQPLERQLPDQKLSGFLVTTDFSKSKGPGPVAMRFSHPAGRGGAFPAALVASRLRGALPSVDLLAVCLIQAIFFHPMPKSYTASRTAAPLLLPSKELQLPS